MDTSCDDQSIRDAAKKRLKEMSEKKVIPKPTLSLYSDEELEVALEDTKSSENNKVVAEPAKISPTKVEEINGKRLYRTDRTLNTDSELSEGEIVDDDDEETAKPLESDKNSEQSEKPRPLFQNHQKFDLRQRIQMRNRGNNIRGRFNRGFRRSRSRSRERRLSRERDRRSKDKKNSKRSSSRRLSDSLESKHSNKKKKEKKSRETPEIAPENIEKMIEMANLSPDDDDEFIKELKLKIKDLKSELTGQPEVKEVKVEELLDKTPKKEETVEKVEKIEEKLKSPVKSAVKKESDSQTQQNKVEKTEKRHESDKKRSKTPSDKSSEKKKAERKRSRTRSPKTKAKSDQCDAKTETVTKKSEETPIKKKEVTKSLSREPKNISKEPKDISKEPKDPLKDDKKDKEKRLYSIKMTDGSVQEIPFALVNHTTTLPKITFSSRFNLNHPPPAEANNQPPTKSLPSKPKSSTKDDKKPHHHDKTTEPKQLPSVKDTPKSKKNDHDPKKASDEKEKPKADPAKSQNRRDSHERKKSTVKKSRSHENLPKKDIKSKESEKKSDNKDNKSRERTTPTDRRRSQGTTSQSSKSSRDRKESETKPKKTEPEKKSESSNKVLPKEEPKRRISDNHRLTSSGRDSRKEPSRDIRPRNDHRRSKEKPVEQKLKPETPRERKISDKKEPKTSHNEDKPAEKLKIPPKKEEKPRRASNHRDRTPPISKLKENDHKKKSPNIRDASTKSSKSHQKPTLSFADELEEVQGLKPAKDEEIFPDKKEIKKESPPKKVADIKSEPSEEIETKRSEHAKMLKDIQSNVSEILAPFSEFEKLAQDRKSLNPEDFLNKIKGLFSLSETKSSEIVKPEEKVAPCLYDPADLNIVEEKPKLESEYETFINSLNPENPKLAPNIESEIKPSKKISRSLSQSTNSSRTSGTTTTSTTNSSSESSSSESDSDSSSSSSDSDSDSDEEKPEKTDQKLSSPSSTPPRDLLPKVDAIVSSTIDQPQTPVLMPLPENRETPIKIQMNLIQKVYSIKKHLGETDAPVFENADNTEKKPSSKENSTKTRKRSRSRSKDESKDSKKTSDRKSTGDKKSKEDDKKRHRTRSRSRDRDRRRDTRHPNRKTSRDRIRRRRSRDRSHRRSLSRSPLRRTNSRRLSPKHRRPRSPRTPESPKRQNYSRSRSRSPLRRGGRNMWNNRDYRRPPSPQSDTESPVAGFKRSLADSTISDAELEQQQLYKIQTHMTTEGFYSYEDPNLHHHHHHHGMPLHDSPRRLSLDDRINMALGGESSKYPAPYPEDAYRYNNYQNPPQYQPHHAQQLQYRYDPAVYNGPQPGMDHYPRYNYNGPQSGMSNQFPARYERDFPMMQPQPRNIKPLQQVSIMTNQGGALLQKGNVLEIVPTNNEHLNQEKVPEVVGHQPEVKKKKLIFTAEELQTRKEKRLEMRKKRKAERDKKRLEKKMRKEKLKLEIKRLVSIGVKDEVLSSDEDAPFDEIDQKGIYGTKDRGILKKEEAEPKIVKKSVKFADGILPGDGSSYSDNDQKSELSPNAVIEKRKKKLKKRKKNPSNENNENKTAPTQELTPFPLELNIPPELENVEPPPAPEGDPTPDLLQPRFLYPNRVPMLFFHLLRPSHYQPPPPPQHHHPHPGHPSISNSNANPALHMNPQQTNPSMNKLAAGNRGGNYLPPTFPNRNLVENLQ